MDNKNSNSMRKVGKGIWETLHAFVLTQELRCLLFWGLFSRCVFRNLSRQGQRQLQVPATEVLQRLVLAFVHEAFLPLQVWILHRSFHLRNLYSDQLLILEECLLCPATSTWGVFTLTSYFQLRSTCPFKDANRIHITPDRCWETWINS